MRMRSRRATVGLAILMLLLLAERISRRPDLAPSSPAIPEQRFKAQVIEVKDGDSLVVRWEGNEATLRLHGVDCPEYDQPFGKEAKAFVRKTALGREIEITVVERDRFGRLVSEVGLQGASLNALVVREGLAWAYRRYSVDYVDEESQARAARRGLWSDRKPEPPWDHRMRNLKSK